MATRILLDPRQDLADATLGPAPVLVEATPTGIREDGSIVILPTTVSFVVNTAADIVELLTPDASWAWTIEVRRIVGQIRVIGQGVQGGSVLTRRTVTWTDTPQIAWADLTDLDPTTLQPTTDVVASWTATQTLAQQVKASLDALVAGAPSALDTFLEVANQLASDETGAAALATLIGTKAPLASPALTGTPTAPTAATSDSSTQLATTALVAAKVAALGTLVAATSATLWKAATAYAVGQAVIEPGGFTVSCMTAHTSASTYDATKWAYPSTARGKTARSYSFVAGVLRNYDDGHGWVLVTDGFHPPIGITNVDSLSDTGLIRVDYPGLKADGTDAGRTVSLLAVPDETLAKAGFIVGASVEPNVARIQIQQTRSLNDEVYWDTTSSSFLLWKNMFWAAGRSPFTVASATNGHLVLTHPQAVLDDRFDFGVDRIGGPGENYLPTISTATAQTILTQLAIDFWTETLNATKTVDWSAIGDNSTQSTTVTVTGAAMGDYVTASMDIALPTGMFLVGSVTAAGTVTATLVNRSGATQDLASGTLRVTVRSGGGGAYRISTPDTKCKAMVRRGTMRSYVAPADVSETTYPGGNIWLFGIMQDQALA